SSLSSYVVRCREGLLGPQRREQDHVSDRRRVRQQHHQPVDANTEAAGGRETVLERAQVVVVDWLRFLVASRLAGRLGLEVGSLHIGIDELGKRIADLATGD